MTPDQGSRPTRPARFAFLDHPGPLAFAHRGGTEAAPENTMAAFEAAVALGYLYLETDVHATADGVLVAFHDDTLDRVTDRRGRIGDLPWREVAAARVSGGHKVPRLDELLGAWPDIRVNIDPKTDAAAALLPEAIRRLGALNRICVGSFVDDRLATLRRQLGPRLCTSMGPRAVRRLRFHSWGLPLGGAGLADGTHDAGTAACAQVPPAWHGVPVADRRFVRTAHRLGLQVHVWTIDDPAAMHRLLNRGVDGLMTDRPSVLKGVLQARGQWAGR